MAWRRRRARRPKPGMAVRRRASCVPHRAHGPARGPHCPAKSSNRVAARGWGRGRARTDPHGPRLRRGGEGGENEEEEETHGHEPPAIEVGHHGECRGAAGEVMGGACASKLADATSKPLERRAAFQVPGQSAGERASASRRDGAVFKEAQVSAGAVQVSHRGVRGRGPAPPRPFAPLPAPAAARGPHCRRFEEHYRELCRQLDTAPHPRVLEVGMACNDCPIALRRRVLTLPPSAEPRRRPSRV